jgi:hypothetical protein
VTAGLIFAAIIALCVVIAGASQRPSRR